MLHPPEFCHWLQGVLDTTANEGLTPAQVTVIKTKLDGVFTHVVEPVQITRPANPHLNPPGGHHRPGDVRMKC